jgi:hypothetical protein
MSLKVFRQSSFIWQLSIFNDLKNILGTNQYILTFKAIVRIRRYFFLFYFLFFWNHRALLVQSKSYTYFK